MTDTLRTLSPPWPHPADFAAPPTRADLERWREADRAARPARLAPASRPDGARGRRRLLRRALGAHALPDRVRRSARARSRAPGDSGKFLVEHGPDVGPRRLPLHDPGRSARPRIATLFECYQRRCRVAGRRSWPTAGVRRVAVEAMTIPHLTWERLVAAAPDVELVPVEGWVEADPAGQGAGRAGARRRGLRRRGSRPRVAAAVDPAGRHRGGAGPRPRVADADRRRGVASRSTSPASPAPEAALPHGSPGDRPVERGRGPALRLRGPGRRLSQRHDPDAVRRRARRHVTSRSTSVVAASQDAAIEAVRDGRRAARARGARCPTAATRSMPSRGRHRGRRPLAAVRARARPRDRPRDARAARRSAAKAAETPLPRRRSSRSSPASTSRARRASGSRTSWRSTPTPAGSSG